MPNIGAVYEDVSLGDIFLNINHYASELLSKKVIGFRGIKLSDSEHLDLIHLLADGGNNFVPEDSELVTSGASDYGQPFEVITKTGIGSYLIPHRNHNMLDPGHICGNELDFFHWSVHIDTRQEYGNPWENLQSYTSMNMWKFEYPPEVGQTRFLSLNELYLNCPKEFKELLSGHRIEEWRSNGTQMMNIWSPFHKHPITGEPLMFWPSWYIKLHQEEHEWFNDIVDWVHEYLYDKNNWFTWSWKEDDFLIFDNRALVHSFAGGWESEKRIFSQGGVGSGVPIPLTNHT